jgi:hypothetical protein
VYLLRLFSVFGSCSRSQQVAIHPPLPHHTTPNPQHPPQNFTPVAAAAIWARIDKCPVDSRTYAAARAVDEVRCPPPPPHWHSCSHCRSCPSSSSPQRSPRGRGGKKRRGTASARAEIRNKNGTKNPAPGITITPAPGIKIHMSKCAAARADEPSASRCPRLPDGGHVNAFHRDKTLAVFEDQEHGLDPALVLLQQRHFVEDRCAELFLVVLCLLY